MKKKAKWIILALLALSLVALFFWALYVAGLRSAGDVDVLQSNHMLETALIAWYVVFIALVLVYSRLTKGDSPRKVPENPRELTITIAKHGYHLGGAVHRPHWHAHKRIQETAEKTMIYLPLLSFADFVSASKRNHPLK